MYTYRIYGYNDETESDKVTASGIVVGVEFLNEIPKEFSLQQNYPNPFNPTTTIKFGLPKTTQVKLEVYNILGERVSELINQELNAGTYELRFDASKLSSGIYIYRLMAGDYTSVKKLMLLK
jgi:hypothetical protein